MARKIAAFDFDGTITQRDTLAGFVAFAGGKGALGKAFVENFIDMVKSTRDDVLRDSSKEAFVCSALAGLTKEELDALGTEYASKLPNRFRTETVAKIVSHKARGHELVIVSASLEYYLKPVAEELGFSKVIGVAFDFGESGRVDPTQGFDGPNVRGAEKALRLQAWIADTAASSVEEVEMWAYGNSSGDDELLAMADHPTWIGKRAKTHSTELGEATA